jgi:hypothetical protein
VALRILAPRSAQRKTHRCGRTTQSASTYTDRPMPGDRSRPVRGDPYAARVDDLRRWQAGYAEAVPIADAPVRSRCTCVGVVHAIRLVPGRSLEVTVTDGTGRLMALWPGRSRLAGLELGGAMRLTGTVGRRPDGVLVVRSPEWALVPGPYE